MAAPIRFWGTVQAVKPRVIVAKCGGETTAKCEGHLLVVAGTRSENHAPPEGSTFAVAIGPAAQQKRQFAPGDLVRGDAFAVPETAPDVPADLYRVGVIRLLARGNEKPPDPPRSDAPLSKEAAEATPRRVLARENLDYDGGVCAPCPYGTVIPVVRLIDPRDWKRGSWQQVAACLGPKDCPHYRAPV